MAWVWTEGKDCYPRIGSGYATREAAIDNAIWNACLKHVSDPTQRDQLWSSLERAGWKVELKE